MIIPFDPLEDHIGHDVVLVTYDSRASVVLLECRDCDKSLLHYDTNADVTGKVRKIYERIAAFGRECQEQEYTDTEKVWDLLNGIQREILHA